MSIRKFKLSPIKSNVYLYCCKYEILHRPLIIQNFTSFYYKCKEKDFSVSMDYSDYMQQDFLLCIICRKYVLKLEEWETMFSLLRLGGTEPVEEYLVTLGFENNV